MTPSARLTGGQRAAGQEWREGVLVSRRTSCPSRKGRRWEGKGRPPPCCACTSSTHGTPDPGLSGNLKPVSARPSGHPTSAGSRQMHRAGGPVSSSPPARGLAPTCSGVMTAQSRNHSKSPVSRDPAGPMSRRGRGESGATLQARRSHAVAHATEAAPESGPEAQATSAPAAWGDCPEWAPPLVRPQAPGSCRGHRLWVKAADSGPTPALQPQRPGFPQTMTAAMAPSCQSPRAHPAVQSVQGAGVGVGDTGRRSRSAPCPAPGPPRQALPRLAPGRPALRRGVPAERPRPGLQAGRREGGGALGERARGRGSYGGASSCPRLLPPSSRPGSPSAPGWKWTCRCSSHSIQQTSSHIFWVSIFSAGIS